MNSSQDGFAAHGVKHLSPSSLYTWMAQPALWVMERLLNHRAPVGCAAHRGTAVESGVAAGLIDPAKPVEECIVIAMLEFDKLTALSVDPKRDKERAGIAGMVAIALTELRQYGIPSALQGRVEHRFEGLSVPIMGFFDFRWDDHAVVVDLKTTHRIPSEASSQHARQVALYIHGTNAEGRLAYTSDKKIAVYRVENPQQHIADLVNVGQRLGRFLAVSRDPVELASMLTPDVDAFWYSDPTARANARRVYGL